MAETTMFLTLLECVGLAKTVPFQVRVSRSGGKFLLGDRLEINDMRVRDHGDNAGEIEYDFTNLSSGRDHTGWRHTSEARFELIKKEAVLPLPNDIEAVVSTFGCYTERVRQLCKLLLPKA